MKRDSQVTRARVSWDSSKCPRRSSCHLKVGTQRELTGLQVKRAICSRAACLLFFLAGRASRENAKHSPAFVKI